ncbi:spore germination protein PE [Bacillus mesophilus]|uniref:Spore germination protein GerPE n=1 Tax=Bacillus mesophilus TaxID=1808955 RepID=A0A6M0Q3A4_9BACI|nr:spore germination protein GerPE [Bacillus mesophilus]MBM7659815.1 spore germination protein PE [Bacillus mesophilus]NEY70674.1 spore germination protein GerPE [Bacillus mesophilus]
MYRRTSIVPNIYINSLAFSSVFEIGDADTIQANSRAIAVQRQFPLFVEGEADFSDYQIFSEPIPSPDPDETVSTTFIHENPVIKVQSMYVIGVSNSSVIQVGSSRSVNAEARVKHIRQLLD